MNKLWQEFKAFAFKGNMLDLAVAVVIGAAFAAVIGSLVKDVFMPAIAAITSSAPGATIDYKDWAPHGIRIGAFLGELVNFLIVALVVFLILVKFVGALVKKSEAAPSTKECPLCLSTIPLKARKCAHCTADLPN